jgi:uncharacterized protein
MMVIRSCAVFGVLATLSFASVAVAEDGITDPSSQTIADQSGAGPATHAMTDMPNTNAVPKLTVKKPNAKPSSKAIAGQPGTRQQPGRMAVKPRTAASSKSVSGKPRQLTSTAVAGRPKASPSPRLIASRAVAGQPKPAAMPSVANANAALISKPHRIVIQVDQNDPAVMNLALNNATNVVDYYRGKQQEVQVDLVTYGPGLHMLRDDTSPVKERIKQLKDYAFPSAVQFSACSNTKENMEKKEGKPISIVSDAVLVPSGVVHVMELEENGWSYIRP